MFSPDRTSRLSTVEGNSKVGREWSLSNHQSVRLEHTSKIDSHNHAYFVDEENVAPLAMFPPDKVIRMSAYFPSRKVNLELASDISIFNGLSEQILVF